MKKLFKILISIILLVIVVSISAMFYLSRGLDEGVNVKLNGIDTSKLNDGVYMGNYNVGRWSNQLSIAVKNHKITEINIKDDVTFAKSSVSDELFSKVIKKQNTKVDVVSGATVTSKAYLKSIENALNDQNRGD